METIVIMPSKEKINKIKYFYNDYQKPNNNQYVSFFAKTDNCSIIVYTSNKVVFQGLGASYEASLWQSEIPSTQTTSMISEIKEIFPAIGSDEVGTGDFFGPIVVCAVVADQETVTLLKNHQITDSKKITDSKILEIFNEFKDKVIYHELVLSNQKYNEQIKLGLNMNSIKAKLHNHAIKKLLTKIKPDIPKMIIVDQFCSQKNYYQYLKDDVVVEVHLETKAESKYFSVALASIFARAIFLQQMDLLSAKLKVEFLKGAGFQVDEQAQMLYDIHGIEIFDQFAKTNFKNIDKIDK